MPKLIRIASNKHRAALSEVSGNAAGVATMMSNNNNNNSSRGPITLKLQPSASSSTSTAGASTEASTSSSAALGGRGRTSSLEVVASSSSKQVKRWDERYDELVKFKVLYGSCRVPHRYPDNPGLSRWVVYMRSSYASGTLPADRIEKLNQVGFVWSDRGHTTWDKRLQQLDQYKALHGTSRVSCDTPESAQLWRWSSVQRANYRLGKLSTERIQALDDLGFIWDVDQHDWDNKFDDLADFYRAFGHTRLPNKDPYKKLFLWARVQRTKFHDNSLSSDRIAKLRLLDFGWEKNAMYTASAGHATRDASGEAAHGDNSRRTSLLPYPSHDDSERLAPPSVPVPVGPASAIRTTFPAATGAAHALTTSHPITMVPKVSLLKSPAPPSSSTLSSKKEMGGFDRLLQLAELARTFSPVPLSPPVRPLRP